MLRPVLRGGDEGQVNFRRAHAGQLDFGLFRRFRQPLQGLAIAPQIQSLGFQELLRQPIHNFAIEIIPAQLRIAAGGLHLKDPIAHFQQGHIKRAAPQVKHQHRLATGPIETIGQRRRRRFINNPLHIQPGNPPRIARGLPLGIVEIGRNRNHRAGHGLAQIALGFVRQLPQNHR